MFLWLQLPWMFMDGFFVLSGWLITGILVDTRERPDYFRAFYVRRALRILPIYYAVLIFIVGVAVLKGSESYQETLTYWGSPGWFFVFLGNIPTAISGHWPAAAGGALVPLWSLQVEEQFYLLFPFLVHRLNLATLSKILLWLCGFSTVLRVLLYYRYPENQLIQYVLLPCHMDGLAMGGWLAIRFRMGPWEINKKLLTAIVFLLGLTSLGTAIWSGYLYSQPFNRTIGFLIAPLWFAAIVLWLVVFSGSRWTALLRNPLLTYLGKVSYAAYLFHQPISNILPAIGAYFGRPHLDQGTVGLILIYLLTFGLAALSWHFFERPLFLLKNRLFPDARLARPA
jgi:peptidoglycan/LPS O-acetylase OafA/YrhL